MGSAVRYIAWVELLSQAMWQVPPVVNPGDQLRVAIAQQADTDPCGTAGAGRTLGTVKPTDRAGRASYAILRA